MLIQDSIGKNWDFIIADKILRLEDQNTKLKELLKEVVNNCSIVLPYSLQRCVFKQDQDAFISVQKAYLYLETLK